MFSNIMVWVLSEIRLNECTLNGRLTITVATPARLNEVNSFYGNRSVDGLVHCAYHITDKRDAY